MMPFLTKFCPMELNQLENVKQKIVVLTQGELVAHAQKQVRLVRNPFSFIQLFYLHHTSLPTQQTRLGNLPFMYCLFGYRGWDNPRFWCSVSGHNKCISGAKMSFTRFRSCAEVRHLCINPLS
jgi:hypothetical protein